MTSSALETPETLTSIYSMPISFDALREEAEERAAAEQMSREFWNTRFTRKYSTFGSEPRSKPNRQAEGKRIDDGYTQWDYAKKWNQRDRSINAINPRVMLAETFGVLLKGPPGPGEYSKVSEGFQASSRFKQSGKFTVKGKGKTTTSKKEATPTKMPVELLSFASPPKDRMRTLTKKKKGIDVNIAAANIHFCGTKVNGKPIENLSEEHLREEFDKFGQYPGPNSYEKADDPYFTGRVGRRHWGQKAPQWSLHTPDSKPRVLIDLNDPLTDLKTKNVPAVGTYNLALKPGKDAPAAPISPVPTLALTSAKRSSPVGPGSYDVARGFDNTTRMTRLAKAYQHGDMRRPSASFKSHNHK